jgi:hypothetical protein
VECDIKEDAMICFEVSLNGKKLCLAGVGEYGVLATIVTWAYSERRKKSNPEDEQKRRLPFMHIGGLMNEEHIDYLERPFYLNAGDEVTIKVIEADTFDEPPFRDPAKSPEDEKEKRRRSYEELKKEFGSD